MPPEAEFKRWITKNAPRDRWLIQTVETCTGSGVPDLFVCTEGLSAWLELKAAPSPSAVYMRVSQWVWLKNLHSKGGMGFLLIKRTKLRRVDAYKVTDLIAIEPTLRGVDAHFENVKPAFQYTFGKGSSEFFDKLSWNMTKYR